METPRKRKSRDQRAWRKNTGAGLNEATLERLGTLYPLEILQTKIPISLSLSLSLSFWFSSLFLFETLVNPGLETTERRTVDERKSLGQGTKAINPPISSVIVFAAGVLRTARDRGALGLPVSSEINDRTCQVQHRRLIVFARRIARSISALFRPLRRRVETESSAESNDRSRRGEIKGKETRKRG